MIKTNIVADSKFPVDRKLIRAKIAEVLEAHKVTGEVELTVMVVGKRKMAQLNKEYMNRTGPTDVLSFPLNDPEDSRPFVDSPDGVLRLGDIVVCYSVAMDIALKRQLVLDRVIVDLVEHGLKHLLGIHHP